MIGYLRDMLLKVSIPSPHKNQNKFDTAQLKIAQGVKMLLAFIESVDCITGSDNGSIK